MKKPIPSPAVPALEATSLFHDVAALIDMTVEPDTSSSETMRDNLASYSSATLSRIAGLNQHQQRATVFHIYTETVKEEPDETYVNDLIALSGYFTEKRIPLGSDGNYLIGARNCTGLAPQGVDGTYPKERHDQLAALMTVTDNVVVGILNGDIDGRGALDFSAGYSSPLIADVELQELILNSSDADRERVVRIVEERRVFAPKVISGLLKLSDSVALSSGSL